MGTSEPEFRLNLPIELHEGESWAAFLLRIAIHNYPGSELKVLLRACKRKLESLGIKDDIYLPRNPETFKMLSHLTWTTAEEIYNATLHRFADVIEPPSIRQLETISLNNQDYSLVAPRRQVLRKTMPYCPVCSRTKGFHSLLYAVYPIAMCKEHECLLLDICYSCGQPTTTEAVVKGKCQHCGCNLSDAPVFKPTGVSHVLASQRYFEDLLLEANTPSNSTLMKRGATARELFNFLVTISRNLDIDAVGEYLEMNVSLSDVSAPYRNLYGDLLSGLVAHRVILDWPNGFYRFLDLWPQLRGKRESLSRLDVMYSPLVSMITGQFLYAGTPMEGAFAAYFLKKHKRSVFFISSKYARALENEKAEVQYIRAKQAFVSYGFLPNSIVYLVNLGLIQKIKAIDQDEWLYKQDDIKRLPDTLKSLGQVSHVATLLGVKRVVVRDLIDCGVLKTYGGGVVGRTEPVLLDPASVEEFLRRLESLILPIRALRGRSVNFSTVSFVLSSSKIGQADVIKKVLNSEIRLYSSRSDLNVSGWRFLSAEIHNCSIYSDILSLDEWETEIDGYVQAPNKLNDVED